MVANAAGEFVPDLYTSAAQHVGLRYRDHALLQRGDGLGNLPRRTRWIATLDRPVIERTFFILPISGDLLSSFRSRRSLDEHIRIERRMRDHGKYLAVVRVHRYYRSAFRRRAVKVLLSGHLKVEVDGRDEVLPGLRRHYLYLVLYAAAAVHDHLSVTGPSAKILVVILLEAAFADDVARTESLLLHFRILKLLRADLADVA